MSEALIRQRDALTPSPAAAGEGSEPGYVVIRQEDALAFSREVRELTAALLMLQKEVEELKRDNAQKVSVNHQQAKGLAARIRQRADTLCEKYDLDPKVHGAAFRAAIKRDVLNGCGVKDPHDIPLRDLPLCMEQIDAWTSYALVRKRREIEKGGSM